MKHSACQRAGSKFEHANTHSFCFQFAKLIK